MRIITLLLMILTAGAYGQSIIQGKITDATTQEPLPFATIAFKGTTTGTVSNAQGSFRLNLPDALPSDTLLISYIGYESFSLSFAELQSPLNISLTPSVMQLEELVILPLSPEEYLTKAVKKFKSNYAKDPFTTTAYYREVFTENRDYISFNEGVFYSSYPNYQDTLPNQHQLVLYRTASDKEEIDFMHQWVEDKTAKEKKKALKKGEAWEESDETTREIIQMGFGGPEQILGMDLMKEIEYSLDSNQFKKFKYRFGKGLTYQSRDIIEILFESKGQVDHQRMEGVIYVDLESDAIVSVAYTGELVVPVWAQPILFAFGLSIKDPIFSKSLKYQYHQGRWYPDTFQWDVAMGLKKRYLFKSNEYSDFTGHQIFKVNDLIANQTFEIDTALRFDPEKDPLKQIHETPHIQWERVNTLPLEVIQK